MGAHVFPDIVIKPARGIVQKVMVGPVAGTDETICTTLWLKHNPALFTEDEWEWVALESNAFIFDTYEKAEAVRKLLKENGEDGWLVAMVHKEGRIAAPEPDEVIRPLPICRKGVTTPTQTFEALEKRGLA